MIDRTHVRWIAEKFLRDSLRQVNANKDVYATMFRPELWKTFIDRLHTRVNEIATAGYMPSQFALHDFVEKATIEYAHKRRADLQKVVKDWEDRNKPTPA